MVEGDNHQLKSIEILLVVGGIIGGLNEDSITRGLIFFLMTALFYYNVISNPVKLFGIETQIIIQSSAIFTSCFFSMLIAYPLLSSKSTLISVLGSSYPIFNIIRTYILATILFFLTFINLRGENERVKFRKENIPILLGIFLIWCVFFYASVSLSYLV